MRKIMWIIIITAGFILGLAVYLFLNWGCLSKPDSITKVVVPLFVAVFPFIIRLFFPEKEIKQKPAIKQENNKGDNITHSGTGDINNYNGVPPELMNKWLDTVNRKDDELKLKDNRIEELTKKYQESEKEIASLKDQITDTNLKKEAEDAHVHFEKGDFSKAEDVYEKLYNLKQPDIQSASDYACKLGDINYIQLKYNEAKKWYEEAVRLNPDNADYLSALGILCNCAGSYSKAIEYLRKALILKKKLGEKHPSIAYTLNNLGCACACLKNYNRAIKYFYKALYIKMEQLGDNHHSVAGTLNNIGFSYFYVCKYRKALKYFLKAYSIYNKMGDYQGIVTTYTGMSFVYGKLDKFDLFYKFLQKALEIKNKLNTK